MSAMPVLEAFIISLGVSVLRDPPFPPPGWNVTACGSLFMLLFVLAFTRVSEGFSDPSHRSGLLMATLPGSLQSVALHGE